MKSAVTVIFAGLFLATAAVAESGRTPSPAGARVFIVEPADGAVVTSPVKVKFGIEGMEVAPAGTDKENTGHHHLIIDKDLPNVEEAIPADANHVHYGKGQTEATVELASGKHTLQLVLGDKNHIPHDPPIVSPVVTITVK